MIPTRKKLIVFSLTALFLAAVVSFSIVFFEKKQTKTAPSVGDLSSHPIYSKYRFDDSTKVINIGTQPLYSPTGFITETMKRDAILTRELAALGFTLRYYPFLKGADVNYFILRNDLDAGVGGDMPALSLASKTSLSITTLMQQGPVSIVTRKYILANDLRHKRIAYAFGSVAHFALLELLEGENIHAEDVKLISMDVHEMVKALSAGKIDAFAAWEPIPELANLYHDFVKNFQSINTGYLYFRRDFFDNYPAVVRQILAAQTRAVHWLSSNRDNLHSASSWVLGKTASLTGKKNELDAVQNAFLAYNDILSSRFSSIAISPASLKEDGALYREFFFLKKLGKISPDVDWQQVLDSFNLEVVQEIYGSSSQYKLSEFEYNDNVIN